MNSRHVATVLSTLSSVSVVTRASEDPIWTVNTWVRSGALSSHGRSTYVTTYTARRRVMGTFVDVENNTGGVLLSETRY